MTLGNSRAFHPVGDETPIGSHFALAETTSTLASSPTSSGIQAAQLDSTHPSPPLVTMTTCAARLHACLSKVFAFTAYSCSSWATASGTGDTSVRPCFSMQKELGHSVSSQSKI